MTATPARPALLFSLACLSALAGAIAPAAAGDFAERAIIGFSRDGGIFAFEQYGRQDGSGFPYADIFLIDTSRDAWIAGTPIRVLLQDEQATLESVRKQAAERAASFLREHGISDPGRLLAHNPPSELSADPHKVTVNALQIVPPSEQAWTFTLSEYSLEAKRCAGVVEPAKAFRLEASKQDGPATVWHEDKSLPESRGCPLRYAISDVVVAEEDGAPQVFAVLISVFRFGFEGPDRRFVAVTGRAR